MNAVKMMQQSTFLPGGLPIFKVKQCNVFDASL